jgi:circadian clock protein KaiC
MTMRLIDFLKTHGITMLATELTEETPSNGRTDANISSLIDTWLSIYAVEGNGERNTVLSVLKSRGMRHSHQLRELLLSDEGIELADVYLGLGGISTGTARVIQEAQHKREKAAKKRSAERKHKTIEAKQKLLKARIDSLTSRLDENTQEMLAVTRELQQDEDVEATVSATLAKMRQADNLE